MAWVLHIVWNEQFKKDVMEFNGIVLVDFWAEWCGPCRMLGPVLEELAAHYEGQDVKIVKIDVDNSENTELASKFEVVSIPAVFLMKNGEVQENVVWVNPMDVYVAKIDNLK